MPQGTAEVDFGAFPGASDASFVVTGQAAILSGSLVEAWVRLVDTVDHLADEHWVETIKIEAGNIVAGVGFTIYALNTNMILEPIVALRANVGATSHNPDQLPRQGGQGTRLYGKWAVGWVWN